MGLVDNQQRPVLARELAQRLVVSGLGMHDADIGHRRLGQHAGHVFGGKRCFERVDVVELDDLGGDRGIHGRPNVSGPRPCAPLRQE